MSDFCYAVSKGADNDWAFTTLVSSVAVSGTPPVGSARESYCDAPDYFTGSASVTYTCAGTPGVTLSTSEYHVALPKNYGGIFAHSAYSIDATRFVPLQSDSYFTTDLGDLGLVGKFTEVCARSNK